MTRQELIALLETAKEELLMIEGLGDYARERTYIDILDAIEKLTENEEGY